MSSRLFVISGPSGVGKGTLVNRIRAARPDLAVAVSATTRLPRQGEIDGQSYYFISDEQFNKGIAQDQFLEWAQVHDHKYGTPKAEVDNKLSRGESLILEIDVQGALNVRKSYPDAVLIFIEAPSLDALEKRLRGRESETEDSIALRMRDAAHEMQFASSYDVRIINDDICRAEQELLDVIAVYEKEEV